MTFQGLSVSVVSAIYWHIAAISLAISGLVLIFVERYGVFRSIKTKQLPKPYWPRVRLVGIVLLALGMGAMLVASIKYSGIQASAAVTTP